MDNLFFSIWRNNVTRDSIRTMVLDGKIITINLPYLFENYRYLSKVDRSQTHIKLIIYPHHFTKFNDQFVHYKHLVTYIKFSKDFNLPLPLDFFPLDLKILDFGLGFDQELQVSQLPSNNLHTLYLSHYFNRKLKGKVLPDSLRNLYFGDIYSHPLEVNILPKQLEFLSLGLFSPPISNVQVLPKSLTKLCVSNSKNQILSPKVFYETSLLDLTVGGVYQDPIVEPLFPKNLESLVLKKFASPIKPFLFPNTLTTLNINNFYPFGQPIFKNSFPSTLTTLFLNVQDSELNEQDGFLPPTLTNLHFFFKSKSVSSKLLPRSIKYLKIGINGLHQPLPDEFFPENLLDLELLDFELPFTTRKMIPNKVVNLTLGCSFIQPLEIGDLPESIKKLQFTSLDQPIEKGLLPSLLTHLVFPNSHSFMIRSGSIPNSVKYLILPLSCGNPPNRLKQVVPLSVKRLTIIGNYSHLPLEKDSIPPVKEIVISCLNCKLLPGSIPSTAKRLVFRNYLSIIDKGIIPDSIETLEFHDPFDQPITSDLIPRNLKKLVISNCPTNPKIPSEILPPSITSLFIPWMNIKGRIPPSIKKLYMFTKQSSLVEIPDSIIMFNEAFDLD
ncbi:hypothetical protein CYY_001137 [Polysphondylium violaceum]|uniref:FNIP repeat-containing protein n=1 Tax=Polysphondylium violaceum TaxID=133409 RepID=A0A8J4VAU3_9MYCE|nr:hypothetical protein CYY_001137 [Polysphondylium violaceum]